MNRIFDLVNKAKVGFWCAAPTEQAAIEIALKARHAKQAENLHVKDVTHALKGKGLDQIIASDQTGRIIFGGVSYTMEEILAGIKREPQGWRFCNPVSQAFTEVK